MALLTQTPATNVFSWPAQGEWTYDDYARLPDNGMRYEVIKRDLFMSPAPSTKHQLVSLNLASALHQFVKKNKLGVAEYWIVDPASCAVDIFVLRGNAYVPLGHFGLADTAVSELFPQFQIKIADFCIPE